MSATAAVAIETLRVGGATCLFRPENHATCLLNDSAAAIVAAFAGGGSDDAVARQLASEAELPLGAALGHVAAMRALCRDSGLLGALTPPERLGPGVRVRARPARAAQPVPRYAVPHGRPVGVMIADARLRTLVEAVLAPLRLAGDGVERGAAVQATLTGRGYAVALDGETIVRDAGRALARRAVLQAVLLQMHPAGRSAAILHASAVAIAERGVLLAGPTGAGKTTLMLALIAAGAGHLADDFTPLAADGKTLGAFPVAASVKSGSWPILTRDFPELATAPTFRLGPRRVRYLDLSRYRAPGADGVAAAVLVLPCHDAGARLRLERLAPEDALQRLLAGGSAPAGAKPSMRPIVDLVSRVPAWSLTYPDLGAGVAAVERLARVP